MKADLRAGIAADRVAITSVLPNGNLASVDGGGREGTPDIGVNEVSGGHTVIFRQIGRNSPDGTNGKQVARALHAAR